MVQALEPLHHNGSGIRTHSAELLLFLMMVV
jgi:hypothetical protein